VFVSPRARPPGLAVLSGVRQGGFGHDDIELDGDELYFDVETVGNVSAASIPIAIYDAVREGAIDRPMRVFTPAFGAGAVGGYTVIRVDPAIVVPEGAETGELLTAPADGGAGTLEDVRAAFGG
jgi:hypothetical protein